MKNRLYDRKEALLYAEKWAMDRNPRYYNFDSVGGDCTSFVSQVKEMSKDVGCDWVDFIVFAGTHEFYTEDEPIKKLALDLE